LALLEKKQDYRTAIRINCATPAVIYWRMRVTTQGDCSFGSATATSSTQLDIRN
jgi:hypothetical protein